MKFRYLLFIISIAVFLSGCVSTRQYYSDQEPLKVIHNAGKDAAADNSSKIVLLIPEHNIKNLKQEQLNHQIEDAVKSENIFNLPVIGQKQHENLAASKGVSGVLKKIRRKYLSGIMDDEIIAYGKKIKADVILIPSISIKEYEDTPVTVEYAPEDRRGDYYWPAFRVIEMQIRAEALINLRVVYISRKAPSDSIMINEEIAENYDTMETFSEKQRSIREDNTRRSIENQRRKREEEYKRQQRERERQEEAARAKSKADNVMLLLGTIADIADDLSGDDWCMIPPVDLNAQFKKSVYMDRSLLAQALTLKTGRGMFRSYLNRYDGRTLKGDCVNGIGDYIFNNGNICSGQWINGAATGQCEYKYVDGSLFQGTFVDGLAEGAGTYKKTNGNIYIGPYKKGQKHGYGLIYIEDQMEIGVDSFGYILKGRNTSHPYLKIRPEINYEIECSKGDYVRVRREIK